MKRRGARRALAWELRLSSTFVDGAAVDTFDVLVVAPAMSDYCAAGSSSGCVAT
jgi:hypothetical protein